MARSLWRSAYGNLGSALASERSTGSARGRQHFLQWDREEASRGPATLGGPVMLAVKDASSRCSEGQIARDRTGRGVRSERIAKRPRLAQPSRGDQDGLEVHDK